MNNSLANETCVSSIDSKSYSKGKSSDYVTGWEATQKLDQRPGWPSRHAFTKKNKRKVRNYFFRSNQVIRFSRKFQLKPSEIYHNSNQE